MTVRSPFLPPERWGEPSIVPVLAPFLTTRVRLSRLEDRPGALVVLAEPDDALWQITDAATNAWPDLLAHKGGRPDAAFHVTVVRTPDPAVRRAAWEEIAPQLPLRVDGTEFWAADAGAVHSVLLTR